jgi:hypothetical protein
MASFAFETENIILGEFAMALLLVVLRRVNNKDSEL